VLGIKTIITYRRRSVTRQDIATITRIIAAHPDKSRRFISQEVCRVWNWRQPNGVLKDMVCRSLLLLLESKGFIKLPARKCTPANPLANRKKPARVVIDQTPIQSPISDLFSVRLKQVRRTPSTVLSINTTILVILSLLESTSNISHFPMTALLLAWHGGQHHGTLAQETVSLAGPGRLERRIFI